MIIALAGRRIDKEGENPPVFPQKNKDSVNEKIRKVFIELNATTLLCSGACGADLLALKVAGDLGMERKMVLPFDKDIFRKKSVTDRPGGWGQIFDRIYNELEMSRNIIHLSFDIDKDDIYTRTNLSILDLAEEMAERNNSEITSLIVWNGVKKDSGDTTYHFKKESEARGILAKEIYTI